jgi:hypothetical protein
MCPHWPQLLVVVRSVSQPSLGSPLQFPKPALQAKLHAWATQAAMAFAGAGHMFPQAPQFAALLVRFVSQPSAALALQSAKPLAHT